MRWKPFDPYTWRRVFALFPVKTLDGVWAWLEHVETRDVPQMFVDRTIYRLPGSTADVSIEPPAPPRGGSVIQKGGAQ